MHGTGLGFGSCRLLLVLLVCFGRSSSWEANAYTLCVGGTRPKELGDFIIKIKRSAAKRNKERKKEGGGMFDPWISCFVCQKERIGAFCFLCIFSFFYGISVSVSFCVTVCFEEGMQMVVFFCFCLSFFFPLVKLDLGLCVCVLW